MQFERIRVPVSCKVRDNCLPPAKGWSSSLPNGNVNPRRLSPDRNARLMRRHTTTSTPISIEKPHQGFDPGIQSGSGVNCYVMQLTTTPKAPSSLRFLHRSPCIGLGLSQIQLSWTYTRDWHHKSTEFSCMRMYREHHSSRNPTAAQHRHVKCHCKRFPRRQVPWLFGSSRKTR